MTQTTAEKPAQFDWDGITATAVATLKAPRITPVPDRIVQLAQASYEGVQHPGEDERRHVLRWTAPDDATADQFHKHLRNAGLHTTPQTSLRIERDPDGTGDTKTIAWRASTRKGPPKQ